MRAWPMDTPFNVADLSMQPPASFPELYAPLWWYSGSYASITNAQFSGTYEIAKGSTSFLSVAYTDSRIRLYTLNSNCPANTKFALEVALWTSSSSYTTYAQLYDLTSGNNAVSGSQVSTTSTTATVVRSGQFTLTPGHIYGISVWSSSTAPQANITDASLIIFPPAGSVSPSLSSISLANPSGGTLKEAYIPLYSYGSGSTSASSTPTTAGTLFIQKGTTSTTTTSTGSAVKLFTLSSNWSASSKFAFEASLNPNSASNTSYAALYDFTASSVVTASQVSASASSFTLIRSGSFTLTPGHVYGITDWCTNTAYGTVITKAHLVALSS